MKIKSSFSFLLHSLFYVHALHFMFYIFFIHMIVDFYCVLFAFLKCTRRYVLSNHFCTKYCRNYCNYTKVFIVIYFKFIVNSYQTKQQWNHFQLSRQKFETKVQLRPTPITNAESFTIVLKCSAVGTIIN